LIALSLERIAEITGGRIADAEASLPVTGPAVIDSRAVVPGALFAALAGERVDGHDYAAGAVAAGAAAVLAARPVGVPAVVVPDVRAALSALARASVAALPDIRVVELTGSSGKTSTKDMLSQVVGRLGPTVATQGSFNNEIGFPLTALRADAGTRFLILEAGTRALGDIAHLTRIVPPDISLVLNVGSAHIGEFGSREVVAKAKGELVEALTPDGTAVLNADDPLVATMAARTAGRIVMYGRSAEAVVRAGAEEVDDRGRPRFELITPEGTAQVRLRLYGAHNVANALGAAAVARELGIPAADIAAALSEAMPASHWRMEVTDRVDGVTVVNDAYNANPESMRAALEAVRHIAAGRRAHVVLGGMAELGARSASEHERLGETAARLGPASLIVVGEEAVLTGARRVESWSGDGVVVGDVEAALVELRRRLRPGDVVLAKGSRVNGLERVAAALLEVSGA
jgi:UDP-N-acetylmuramoyl-tripeptide--D-alanyl-D-alanine ligase